jgi:hypothetical protein
MSDANDLVRPFDETPSSPLQMVWATRAMTMGAPDMSVQDQIDEYIAAQSAAKGAELQELHQTMLRTFPDCKLWFLDGRNGRGQIVSNPNIGYGSQTIEYANGKTKEFYKIGISANTTGISVYFIGIDDKRYLSETYGRTLGKANITGYCIKFKSIRDINRETFEEMIAGHMDMLPAL